jgi:hypothetical protein
MTEDELIEKVAKDLVRLELSAQRSPWRLHTNEILDFLVEKCWHDQAPNARAALTAIREAVGDPLTLVAHIRELEADNKDFLEQITVQTESVLFKELQETIARNNALFAENVALREREVT